MAMYGSYNARSVGGAGRGCVAGAPPGEGARIESALLVDRVYERSVWELDVMGRRTNGSLIYTVGLRGYLESWFGGQGQQIVKGSTFGGREAPAV